MMSKTVLTRRQKQILNLILAGKVNKEIAAVLNLEYQTVKNQVSAAYRVLGISTTNELFPILDRVRAEIAE